MRLLTTLIVGLVFCFSSMGVAQDFYKGRVAYDNKDYREAYRIWKLLAENGDGDAQTGLGMLYSNGLGVGLSQTEAVKWYRLAAAQNDPYAINNLGTKYLKGLGVKKNLPEAIRLFRLAAEMGNDIAQSNLGDVYREGLGVRQDYAKAMEFYRLSAEQGNASAQNGLGYLYGEGLGVKKDVVEALKWYRLALDQDNSWAQVNVGHHYYAGEGVTQDLEEAARLFQLSAAQANQMGQNNLAVMYENGLGGLDENNEMAIAYFCLASFGNNEPALASLKRKQFSIEGCPLTLYNLGYRLLQAKNSKSDINKARRFIESAANRGLAGGYAETTLGWSYFTGKYAPEIPKDHRLALYWNGLGAEAGHTNAHSNMALHYFTGLGVDQDFEKMRSHLIQSAELMNDNFRWVIEEPDEWLDYKDMAPVEYWQARELWWQAVETKDSSYIDQLKLLAFTPSLRTEIDRSTQQSDRIEKRRQIDLEQQNLEKKRVVGVIREIQSLLIESRYLKGSADGQMGPQTRRALSEFRRDAGLPFDIADTLDKTLEDFDGVMLDPGKPCGPKNGAANLWTACLTLD